MYRLLILLGCIAIFPTFFHAQKPITDDELRAKANTLLLEKDLRALADELTRTEASTIEQILIRLEVLSRVKNFPAIRRQVVRLAGLPELPALEQRGWLLELVRSRIHGDLAARRLYYEHLTPDDGAYHIGSFVGDWGREGNEKDLEAWLAPRAIFPSGWFWVDLGRRVNRNDAQPVLNAMAGRLRSDLTNRQALRDYLAVVKQAQTHKAGPFDNETHWLADTFVFNTALDNYEFGEMVRTVDPALSIGYFRKSLDAPVSEADISSLTAKYPRHTSIGTTLPPVNWEKQIRYWAKEKLAMAYRDSGQGHLAQPLVEDMVATKTEDILSRSDYQLAGSAQFASGARAVESKVLAGEAEKADSLYYWSDRVQYYVGRKETDGVISASREGLKRISKEYEFRYFVMGIGSACRAQIGLRGSDALSEVLLDEFLRRASSGSEVSRQLAYEATGQCGLKSFTQKAFIDRRTSLIPMLKDREWEGEDIELLDDVLSDERLPGGLRQHYIAELERLATKGTAEQKFSLAGLFERIDEHPRRIPLLLSNLKDTKRENSTVRIHQELFQAYIDSGRWREAEALLEKEQNDFLSNLGNRLTHLAMCAGRQNAPEDALRIWKRAVNFDGHSEYGLINFVETTARPLMVEYYLAMKKQEPTSETPDRALRILRYGR
jgi:hypothetical protein